MKIVANDKLIKRNSLISQVASLGGLVVLFGGLFISFSKPEMFTFAWGALLLGFILSQVGIYFGSRFGRSPRPDQQLDTALKGMDDRFAIYHYTTPTAHMLVGPVGIWVLVTRQQRGRIVFEKNRYRVKGGGFIQTYLSFFGQEGIGRPELEVPTEIDSVEKHLLKKLPEGSEIPPVQGILVFLNPLANLDEIGEAPIPAVSIKELKEFVRKGAKGKALSPQKTTEIQQALGEGWSL